MKESFKFAEATKKPHLSLFELSWKFELESDAMDVSDAVEMWFNSSELRSAELSEDNSSVDSFVTRWPVFQRARPYFPIWC